MSPRAPLLGRVRWLRLLRGEGPRAGPVTLRGGRIFILPTGRGIALAVLLVAMLLGSLNYRNSLGLLFTFLFGSLATVSALATHRNLADLTVAPGRPEPVFAGQGARFLLRVMSPGGVRRAVVFVPRAPDARRAVVDAVPGGTAVALERPALRRGRLPLGALTVETRFPLGLFRAWAVAEFSLECLVYPAPGPRRPLPPGAGAGVGGEDLRARGAGDFEGLRAYQPGESLRAVHWRASARAEALLAKQFAGEAGGELWLRWDDLPGLDPEARLSQLCRWALDAAAAGRPWGLALPGLVVGPGAGAEQRVASLAALAEFEP